MTTITHSRKKFYHGKDIHWYEILAEAASIPPKFLRMPETNYFEYGGTHEDALKDLTDSGFNDIVEGDEL